MIKKKAAIAALNAGLTVPYRFIPTECMQSMTDGQKHAAINANIPAQLYKFYNLLTMRKIKRTIPPDLLDVWQSLFRKGDNQRIADFAGVSSELVSIAMKQGQATPELTLKISEYYAAQKAANETPNDLIKKAQEILK